MVVLLFFFYFFSWEKVGFKNDRRWQPRGGIDVEEKRGLPLPPDECHCKGVGGESPMKSFVFIKTLGNRRAPHEGQNSGNVFMYNDGTWPIPGSKPCRGKRRRERADSISPFSSLVLPRKGKRERRGLRFRREERGKRFLLSPVLSGRGGGSGEFLFLGRRREGRAFYTFTPGRTDGSPPKPFSFFRKIVILLPPTRKGGGGGGLPPPSQSEGISLLLQLPRLPSLPT